jgi:hypothetical protein
MHATAELDHLVDRILTEGPIGLSPAARLCGTYRAGRNVHPSTLSRWHYHGCPLPDGSVVRLEAVRVAGKLMTSRQALIRFIEAQQPQTPAQGESPAAGAVRSPTARTLAATKAAEELERMRALAIDPSKGSDAKPGDFQAFAFGGVAADGTIFMDCELRREPVTEMVARGLRIYHEFGAGELAVEENGTLGLMLPEFRRQCQEGNRLANVVGLTHTEAKMVRVRHLGSYLSRRQIRVRNTPGGRALVDQLRDIPTGEYDDAADAAAMLVSRMEALTGEAKRRLHGHGGS